MRTLGMGCRVHCALKATLQKEKKMRKTMKKLTRGATRLAAALSLVRFCHPGCFPCPVAVGRVDLV